jgi:tetratricopeptide (TPR) repeat protein
METNRKLVIVLLLFSLPLVYLFYKVSRGPALPKEENTNTQARPQNIVGVENAARANPTFDNLLNLSVMYINNEMPERSIGPLQMAISLNPQSAVAQNQLGVAYIMLQQYQNGTDALQKALQIDNRFQPAKENLEWANYERNRVLLVIKLQEQTPVDQRNAAFNMEYGLNYFKIGDYDKSIEIWKKIAEADQRNSQALVHIGTALILKKQYNEAIVVFKQVLEIEPGNQVARKNLAWIIREKEKLVTGH